MAKDILQPVSTTNSSSPSINSIQHQTDQWKRQGETSPIGALQNDFRKPIDPKSLRK